ncbi:hypothetical protein TanjilG_11471 [Lupinus angustifolius]|uniref:FAF domain-containing protein n=1 Tax=Lupinus angustifolius TaxID=3871 RepID=A0A1J7HJZ6_LUPAN|nr:PREDICTED: protein FANTASTIC FOUR 2-like [Lupinus angustifolius]OIW06746.1 hypothetical protein TanjilG_11471 [Lupinus angustifolius]
MSSSPSIYQGSNSWSFIQSLSNICNKTKDTEGENVYVHPTIKRSPSMLSSKSLEMCTENLGCETGSNSISLFSSQFSSCFIEDTNAPLEVIVNINSNSVSKRLNHNKGSKNIPPPLTSLVDFGGVQVRPRREYGRLILEAVTSSSPQHYFEAERSNGKLSLRLFGSFDDEVDYDAEEEACDEEYIENEEDEIEITKFGRPSRCKESGNRDIFGDGYFELASLSLCL